MTKEMLNLTLVVKFAQKKILKKTLKTSWPLFMNGVQLPQEYRVTMRRQVAFNHSVPRSSLYPFNQSWKDDLGAIPSSFELRTSGLESQHLNH